MTVPVQVPQGQVVQPYVNESGTLTHVVLSPQQYQQLHAGQGHIHPSFVSTKQTLRHESTLSSSLTRPKSSDYSITVLVCKKKQKVGSTTFCWCLVDGLTINDRLTTFSAIINHKIKENKETDREQMDRYTTL